MSTKLLAAAMAAGLGFGLTGAYAQSVNLQGPQLAAQETKSSPELAQGVSDSQRIVQSGPRYEGYTLPGHSDDVLLMARIDPSLVLAESEVAMNEEAVARGSDGAMSQSATQ